MKNETTMSPRATLRRAFLGVLLPVCVLLASCGKDNSTTPPNNNATKSFIAGSITSAAGLNLSGVVVEVSSGPLASYFDTTGTDGLWRVDSLPVGSYNVRPARQGYTFEPVSTTVTLTASGSSGIPFEASAQASLANKPEMVAVPAGEYVMGTGTDVPARPLKPVMLTRGMWVAATEVTQEQYQRVMGVNPSVKIVVNGPVTGVLPADMAAYCNKLSQIEGLEPVYVINGHDLVWNRSANGYRLPSNAEWEYFARASDTSDIPGVSNRNYTKVTNEELFRAMDPIAWYLHNCASPPDYKNPVGPWPVGLKRPNAWGLYDVIGNVNECVYGNRPEGTTFPLVDPVEKWEEAHVPIRGGSYQVSMFRFTYAGTFNRGLSLEQIGFRVVRNR